MKAERKSEWIKTGVPNKATKEELESHMTTHWPYRSWCRHCVSGKGKCSAHKSVNTRESTVPDVAIDYNCMTEASGSDDLEAGMPIVFMVDDNRGHVSADMLL